ncbi:MAG: hypothetical protein U9O55_03695 [Patescibacteria group bacterium]|nr:hypothetical protein [Patescibacteria group bacterium]
MFIIWSDLHPQIKEKHIHQLTTRYTVTALPRASTHICLRYLPAGRQALRQTSDMPKRYTQFKKYFFNMVFLLL